MCVCMACRAGWSRSCLTRVPAASTLQTRLDPSQGRARKPLHLYRENNRENICTTEQATVATVASYQCNKMGGGNTYITAHTCDPYCSPPGKTHPVWRHGRGRPSTGKAQDRHQEDTPLPIAFLLRLRPTTSSGHRRRGMGRRSML